MTETQKTQTVRIYTNFAASLDECPSCGFEQDFADEFGKTECRNCNYHVGCDLADQWNDFWDKTTDPPVFVEIVDTHYGDGNYCEIAIPQTLTAQQAQEFENWIPEDWSVDESGMDEGSLRRVGAEWLRMYTEYSAAPAGSDAWHLNILDELLKLRDDINDPSNDRTATTEWSRDALALDRKACDWAIEQAQKGNMIFVAQDEDGFYFALRLSMMAAERGIQ